MEKLNSHAETLLMAKPEVITKLAQNLSTEIRRVARDPESGAHFRETAHMGQTPGESVSTTESGLLRAMLESASTTGRSEGRAVTKFQLSLMSSIIGVLWLATMFAGSAIWSDMKARVSTSETQIQSIALDVNTLKGRDTDKDRRLEKIENKLDQILDELRKPK